MNDILYAALIFSVLAFFGYQFEKRKEGHNSKRKMKP